ncbi:hypothetical protein HYH03_011006 [Edaphochlamys debaryana]|uniref:Uncharacterized protein n=1 Tax=Edaphochlamys debaryana TaxID=47281 RepID=A0A836BWY5_9CHLO|nr:hypothetical protein HYH03_011006 [Edaphochlamys debaryana]|eukprot:KAG2490614.1 hypothetical protein HYH03_011006 [Edaphochlamys debaryana]
MCTSAWYSRTARPCGRADAGVAYEWSITKEALAGSSEEEWLHGTFSCGTARVVAKGFDWRPLLIWPRGKEAAGVYLCCDVPPVLLKPDARSLLGVVCPGPAQLVVWAPKDGGTQEAVFNGTYGSSFVPISRGVGETHALPLAAASAAGSNPVDRWARYLRDGKISGILTWQ